MQSTVTPDRQLYPPGNPTHAAIRVQLVYRFSRPEGTSAEATASMNQLFDPVR